MNDNHDELGRFASSDSAIAASKVAHAMEADPKVSPKAKIEVHEHAAKLHELAAADPATHESMQAAHVSAAKVHGMRAEIVALKQKIAKATPDLKKLNYKKMNLDVFETHLKDHAGLTVNEISTAPDATTGRWQTSMRVTDKAGNTKTMLHKDLVEILKGNASWKPT